MVGMGVVLVGSSLVVVAFATDFQLLVNTELGFWYPICADGS